MSDFDENPELNLNEGELDILNIGDYDDYFEDRDDYAANQVFAGIRSEGELTPSTVRGPDFGSRQHEMAVFGSRSPGRAVFSPDTRSEVYDHGYVPDQDAGASVPPSLCQDPLGIDVHTENEQPSASATSAPKKKAADLPPLPPKR